MKPKYKITKSQLRKRKRRREVTKPVRMFWRNQMKEIAREYATGH
jgi:hypothetical protein